MPGYRIYVDESGDHTYKQVDSLQRRYLALTGVVVIKSHYDVAIRPSLENLKRKHFSYDPDNPVVLHRSDIVKRKRWFGVLREPARAVVFDEDLVNFIATLQAQVFTVVIDKWCHKRRYPQDTFDPYHYALAVLLNRIRGYLNIQRAQADVIAESRGKKEDSQLQRAYRNLRTVGGGTYGTAEEYVAVFPEEELNIRSKEMNIAGLQIADLLVTEQKIDIAIRHRRPVAAEPSPLARRLLAAADHMINSYGRVLLD